ncbi:MAG TPA: PEP/pyruvate-binding domain-containing protein, partial [Bacteroidia bacterium]|nr:PEP/pyruvate-binding domain-containing protein [Bacteroidia bacterium]
MKTNYIISYDELGKNDVALVGGKNASLGEMANNLKSKGIQVPDGFATTAFAFQYFLQYNKLNQPLNDLFLKLDKKDFSNLSEIGEQARTLVRNAVIPTDLKQEIITAYKELCIKENREADVAVRSSATAEDLPTASFAGQHDSFLNINGNEDVVDAVHRCFVSLFNNRAIKYREDNGFEQMKVYLSAGVQLMVRSDLSSAGVIFTLEPESGFKDVIVISGVWGLGENIVQGAVTPDEFHVFKTTL